MPKIQSTPFQAAPIYQQPHNPVSKKTQKTTSTENTANHDQLNQTDLKTGEAPSQIPLFEQDKTSARAFLNTLSAGAFDPMRSVNDQLINLKTSYDVVDTAAPESVERQIYYALSDPSTSGTDEEPRLLTARIGLDSFSGVDSLDEMQNQLLADLATDGNVVAALGENPSPEEVEAYLQDNYLGIAQLLGHDLEYYYDGFVSLNGDVDAFSSLNERGGVCSDIAGAIAAFHKANGSEAYIMMSTGNDYAHVINLFQRDGIWYIQNYQHIVPTEAQTLEELYDIVMPENREIKLWEVNEDGSLSQVSTDHLTATGRAERRFRSEAGVGGFSPWQAVDGVHIGTHRIAVSQNGVFAEVDMAQSKGALGYYRQNSQAGKDSVKGVAIEGQYDAMGYQRSHIDAKFESEKRWVGSDRYGREHVSVFAGVEGSTSEPAYWGGDESRDPIGRVGVSYARNAARVYGERALKFELGSETRGQAVFSSSLKDPGNFQTAGLMYSDLKAEQKVMTGARFQPGPHLTVRSGLSSGVDLDNIDGTHIPTQLGNILESDVYLDIRLDKGAVAANLIGDIPLHNPSQYKVGAGMAISPLKNGAVVVGATYLQERVVTDRIDRMQLGAEIYPTQDTALGANLTTPVFGANRQDVTGQMYFEMKF